MFYIDFQCQSLQLVLTGKCHSKDVFHSLNQSPMQHKLQNQEYDIPLKLKHTR